MFLASARRPAKPFRTIRAISGPLARGSQCTGGPVLIVAALGLLALDMRVDRIGDRLVSALSLMLVDHRGPLAVVAHPGHQVPEPGAAPGREVVTGVAKVVEMQT